MTTALEAASDTGHRETVELLLRRGADPDIVGGCRGSALEAASLGGHVDIVQLLLAKGANSNIHGGSSHGILLTAVLSGNTEFVELIIHNQQTQGGWQYENAVKAALSTGNKEIIGLLHTPIDIEPSTQKGEVTDSEVRNTCTDLIISDPYPPKLKWV